MRGARAKAERRDGIRTRSVHTVTVEEQHAADEKAVKRQTIAIAEMSLAQLHAPVTEESPDVERARAKRARRAARNLAYRH